MEGNSNLYRVQIFALDVFDEGKFQALLLFNGANQRGNLRESCHLSGTPATFAGDQAILLGTDSVDRDRLEETVGLDGASQFVELLHVECGAGLVLVGLDLIERDAGEILEIAGEGAGDG